ncbi:MAG: Small ribosomal subunit biogenesis GTPase [Eubacteriales bacterium SKADARSKE-1]|nr:Small ribosomal subunit biogenesis GTPase [Eubacteriales bacterium SKADARSKE-1]
MEEYKGTILKGIGGFYYVNTTAGVFECKAAGKFRKDKLIPLVGDTVFIETYDNETGGYAAIKSIKKRKNQLIRPPIANIDKLLIVLSVCDPAPNTIIIDKLIAMAISNNIEPVLIISKIDLSSAEKILDIYKLSGIKSILFSRVDGSGEDLEEIKSVLKGNISAFTGNSGVGKSTILNCLDKTLGLQTGDISKKLGRGRHTTRHVELFLLPFGGYVADTPGFSSIDIGKFNIIKKSELAYCFKEFRSFINFCKFTSCSHTGEVGCAVVEAVNKGEINLYRYKSYISIYNEIKSNKEWEKS